MCAAEPEPAAPVEAQGAGGDVPGAPDFDALLEQDEALHAPPAAATDA